MNPNEPTAQTTAPTVTPSNPGISEQNFPIRINWVWKQVTTTLMSVIFLALFISIRTNNDSSAQGQQHFPLVFVAILAVLFSAPRLIIALMQRKYFHFEFGDQYITIRQGIIKRQERHIPYGVIQDVTVKQSLADRVFGISSINASNATQQTGMKGMTFRQSINAFGSQRRSATSADGVMGSRGSDFSLPGQSPEAAEQLRQVILAKMKENPDWGIQAGL